MNENQIVLNLSKPEALVLFEWLESHDDSSSLPFNHPSEEKVLWKIAGQLESILVEPLNPNYEKLLAEARKIVGSEGV